MKVNCLATAEDMEAKKQKLDNGRPSKGLAQIMYCEIFRVTCNSHIMFDIHVASRKHKDGIKNLTMVDSKEYIEMKKKKVLENGAKVDEVKLCELRNVVCSSLTVFESHCNGQKHRSMVKEQEEHSSDSDVVIIGERRVQPNGTYNPPRRSSRRKQNVSYNEKADVDDDFLEVHKKKQLRNESNEAEDIPNGKEEEADPGSDPEEFTYPDPEFFQFDKIRQQTKFAVDQIGFVWFESDPDQSTLAWSCACLPVATGRFKLGMTELTSRLLMFSHVVLCGNGSKRNTFDIYPRTGEIWALSKNWDIRWSSKPGKKRKFKYEMVEVVSDFTDSTGFVVMPLVKINGFVSLFMQSREAAPVVIPISEVLRFSHSVPLYCTTGNERDGVPEGAFELDPASLPPDLDNVFSSIDLDEKPKQQSNSNHSSAQKEEKTEETEHHDGDQDGHY